MLHGMSELSTWPEGVVAVLGVKLIGIANIKLET